MHSQSGSLCNAALPDVLSKKNVSGKKELFIVVAWFFITINSICYKIEEPSMKPASWTLGNFGRYPKFRKWSSRSRPTTRIAGKFVISLIFDGYCMFGCSPGAVGAGARRFAGLWRPLPPDANGEKPIRCPYRRPWRHRCLEAWGFDARIQRWLAGLAG